MANEYIVYAEDMEMIANAIRLKSGSSEQLLFPNDFVTEIENLSGNNNAIPSFDTTCMYTIIDDGDGNWRIKFLTSGTFIPRNSCTIDVFLVGGGGAGSSSSGGGGGYTRTERGVYLLADQSYEVIVGAGGDRSDGGATSGFGYSVEGGRAGSGYYGGAGGSGGSGYGTVGGVDGGDGTYNGGAGQGSTTREFEEADGTLYSTGGSMKDSDTDGVYYGEPNTGDGGDSGHYAGGSGIVVIRNVRG